MEAYDDHTGKINWYDMLGTKVLHIQLGHAITNRYVAVNSDITSKLWSNS